MLIVNSTAVLMHTYTCMYVVGIHSINAQIAQLPDCLLLAAARYVGVGSVCTINTYLYVPKLKALLVLPIGTACYLKLLT